MRIFTRRCGGVSQRKQQEFWSSNFLNWQEAKKFLLEQNPNLVSSEVASLPDPTGPSHHGPSADHLMTGTAPYLPKLVEKQALGSIARWRYLWTPRESWVPRDPSSLLVDKTVDGSWSNLVMLTFFFFLFFSLPAAGTKQQLSQPPQLLSRSSCSPGRGAALELLASWMSLKSPGWPPRLRQSGVFAFWCAFDGFIVLF